MTTINDHDQATGLRRRQLLVRGGALALGALPLASFLSACGSSSSSTGAATTADAEIGGQLKAIAWLPYADDKVAAPFLNKYGVNVQNSPMSSNDELLTKLKAGGLGNIDLISPNVAYATELHAADVLEPIDTSLIPNLGQLIPSVAKTAEEVTMIEGQLYAVPYLWGYDAMVYNATAIPTPPTSWKDVMNPEYKGKIILSEGANANFEIWPRVLGYDPSKLTTEQLEKTVEFLIELKKTQVRAIIPDQNTQLQLLQSGEAWIIASGSFAGMPAFVEGQKGDKIASTIPAEGGASWIDSWMIPKEAPNAATAAAYINFMIGAGPQAQLADKNLEATVNEKAVAKVSADNRKLFPYTSGKIGSGKLPLFKLPNGDPQYATLEEWNSAWEQVAAA